MSINYHTTFKKLLVNSKNLIFCVLRKTVRKTNNISIEKSFLVKLHIFL